MISNSVIQADLIASLKGNGTLTARLERNDGSGGAESVKESQYAGTTFTYPAVRVRVNRQIPRTEAGPCDIARLSFSIRVLTEGGSSKDADEIAAIVNNHFHGDGGGRKFQGAGWSTFLRSSGLDSALRTGERAWMAIANFEGTVYPA